MPMLIWLHAALHRLSLRRRRRPSHSPAFFTLISSAARALAGGASSAFHHGWRSSYKLGPREAQRPVTWLRPSQPAMCATWKTLFETSSSPSSPRGVSCVLALGAAQARGRRPRRQWRPPSEEMGRPLPAAQCADSPCPLLWPSFPAPSTQEPSRCIRTKARRRFGAWLRFPRPQKAGSYRY